MQGISEVPNREGRFYEIPKVGANAKTVCLVVIFWRFDPSDAIPKQSGEEVKWGGVGARAMDFGEALIDD